MRASDHSVVREPRSVSSRPSDLPRHLRGRAFRLADAPEVSRRRSRASDLWTPVRGARLPIDQQGLASICHAVALSLPAGAAFSHTTAAVLWGLPLPLGQQAERTVHVTTPTGTRARRGRLIIGHQRELAADQVRQRRGLPLTSPSRTFCDLSEILDLDDLVAVGDRVAHDHGAAAIEAELARRPRNRQSRVLREAVALIDDRAESPKETELRLLLVRAGFGPFAANFVVRDASGRFIARVDLALPAQRIAVEYEGDHHRDRDQWRRDLARRRRLEALGWIYLPVTQADLSDPADLLADLRAAVARRG